MEKGGALEGLTTVEIVKILVDTYVCSDAAYSAAVSIQQLSSTVSPHICKYKALHCVSSAQLRNYVQGPGCLQEPMDTLDASRVVLRYSSQFNVSSGRTAVGPKRKPCKFLGPNKCVDTQVFPKHVQRPRLLLAPLDHLHCSWRQHWYCVPKCWHLMELHQSK